MNPNYKPNSIYAYFGIQPYMGNRQRQVLETLIELGRATDREICDKLGWTINRITNRRGELLKKHLIISDGSRKNEYGYLVEMWRPNPNYKLDCKNKTIDKFGLEKAQEPLPRKRYFAIDRDGVRREIIDGKMV